MSETVATPVEQWEQDFEPIHQVLFPNPEAVVAIRAVIATGIDLGKTREHGQRLVLRGIEFNRLSLTPQLDLQLVQKSDTELVN